MVQDIFPHTLDNAYKNCEITDCDYVVIFAGKSVAAVKLSDTDYRFPSFAEVKDRIGRENTRYLFSVDTAAYFLYESDSEANLPGNVKMLTLSDVRRMKYASFKEMYFLICTAYHLHAWYSDNRYCGRCREKLVHDSDERVLVCPHCDNHIYPRISPAVIAAVTDGDRIVLSKYAGREYKGYALISGFAEIGETLEQTVQREVMEEIGVKVKNIRYYKSQPGGIDGNILSGFFCELDGGDKLTIDENELAFAGWFKREEIPIEDDGFSLTYEMIGKFAGQKENG